MSDSSRGPSRRRCGGWAGRKPAPDGSRRLAWVRPVALVALLCGAPMVSARQKEVHARWDELTPLVEKREIETVLAIGVHVRGRPRRCFRKRSRCG